MLNNNFFPMFIAVIALIGISACSFKNATTLKPKKEMQITFSMSMQRMNCTDAGNILNEMRESYPDEVYPFKYIDTFSNSEKSLRYDEMFSLVQKCEVNEITPDESLIFSSFVAHNIDDISNMQQEKYEE